HHPLRRPLENEVSAPLPFGDALGRRRHDGQIPRLDLQWRRRSVPGAAPRCPPPAISYSLATIVPARNFLAATRAATVGSRTVAGPIRVDIDGLSGLTTTLTAIQHQLDNLG